MQHGYSLTCPLLFRGRLFLGSVCVRTFMQSKVRFQTLREMTL